MPNDYTRCRSTVRGLKITIGTQGSRWAGLAFAGWIAVEVATGIALSQVVPDNLIATGILLPDWILPDGVEIAIE